MHVGGSGLGCPWNINRLFVVGQVGGSDAGTIFQRLKRWIGRSPGDNGSGDNDRRAYERDQQQRHQKNSVWFWTHDCRCRMQLNYTVS